MKLSWRARSWLLIAGLLFPACALLPQGDDQPAATPTPETESPPASPGENGETTGGTNRVTGSGNVRVEEREVAGFDRIRVGGIADLFIEQADEESLTIEAEDNLLPLLTSEVVGDRLTLGIRPNTTITATEPIVIRVTVRSLEELDASGTGRVEAAGIDTTELQVEISGSVEAAFAGAAQSQVLSISGTGEFDGRDLRGRRAVVEVSGTGEVTVNVADQLDVRVSGTAAVRYLGEPRVSRQVSGLGSVERAQ